MSSFGEGGLSTSAVSVGWGFGGLFFAVELMKPLSKLLSSKGSYG